MDPVLFLFMIVISALIYYWPLTLTGLAIWALVAYINRAVADRKPSYPRRPVRARPVAKGVQTRPDPKPVRTWLEPKSKPAREMPAPEYLARWTASRRLDAGSERAQWQKKFDCAAQ